ncbi:MAG TPA: ABC transporter permease, partial [Geobacter sp.]|nr:ABC transporter permease [Geobacter sp.]
MNPVLKRTLAYFVPYWKLIVVSAVCSAIVGGMDGAFAWLIEPVLKKIFSGKDTGIFMLVPLGVVVLFAVRGVARFTYDVTIKLAGQKAVQDLSNEIYASTVRQDMAFFNRRSTGDLMSHATNDISAMQQGIANVMVGLFRDILSACSLLGVIFYRNWQLAIFTFVVIPLTAYPAQLIGKKIKNSSGRSLNIMG